MIIKKISIFFILNIVCNNFCNTKITKLIISASALSCLLGIYYYKSNPDDFNHLKTTDKS